MKSQVPALEIRQLEKTYSNGFQAVKGINLTVNHGDFYALLGPNGAGKSTTIGIISSLVNKTSGSVLINGIDLDKQPAKAKALLGVVPQEINLNIFETCYQTLLNQAMYYGTPRQLAKQRTETLLKQLELWEKRDQPAQRLSGGMKRRLMIARALVHHPKILILDEPTAGVDVEIRQSMWQFLQKLKDEGLTIVLTTHYLEEAESLCNKVAIIDHGDIKTETSMRKLLMELEEETLVFYLAKPLKFTPKLEGFKTRLIDAETLEIDVERGRELNCIFRQLNTHDIEVVGMRNKANRLEQLFIRLVHSKEATA